MSKVLSWMIIELFRSGQFPTIKFLARAGGVDFDFASAGRSVVMRNFGDISFDFDCAIIPVNIESIIGAMKLDFELTGW